MKIKMLCLILTVALAGCSSLMRGRNMPASAATSKDPMVFGGKSRDIYLGNISSDKTNPDSIFNSQGKYGAADTEFSINNPKSDYGALNSDLSACNPDAANPPIIVDKYNIVLGVFTLNKAFKTTLPDNLINSLRKLCE